MKLCAAEFSVTSGTILSANQLPAALAAVARAHPGARITLYFHDEARPGQKGRIWHRWWLSTYPGPVTIPLRISVDRKGRRIDSLI